MTTIKDVSRLAKVSIASVSKVMNGNYTGISEPTKERILQAAKKLNYRPNRVAQSLVKSKSSIVGLVVPDIANPYYAELIKGAEDAAFAKDYNVILCNTDENAKKERRHIDMLIGYNADGIILCGSKGEDEHSCKLLAEYNIPFITIDRKSDNAVFSDSRKGLLLAVEHLFEMGHSKIAFIGGDAPESEPNGRHQSFLEALDCFSLPKDASLYKFGSYSMKTGYNFARELLEEKRDFTAIFCGNDLIAYGALEAISEKGLNVPEDISLVGYDDIILSSFFKPKLTTVRQDAFKVGKDTMSLLLQSMDDKNILQTLKHAEPVLVKRESVKNISM